MTPRPAGFLVLVAAGDGARLGIGTRKAAVELAGLPLVVHSLRALAGTPGAVGGVLVVHPADLELAIGDWAQRGGGGVPWVVVAGGETRAESTAAGLEEVDAAAEWILVHDAARPLLDPRDRDAVIERAVDHGAAILAAPVADTLKRVEGDRIIGEVARDELWAAQTPQVFSREARARAMAVGPPSGTDEAGWLAAAGIDVAVVAARHPNPKITHMADIEVVESLLRHR